MKSYKSYNECKNTIRTKNCKLQVVCTWRCLKAISIHILHIYIFVFRAQFFSGVDIENISVKELEHRPKCRLLQILNFWNVTLPRLLQSKPCLAYDYTIPRFLHDHKRGKVVMKTTWKTLQEVQFCLRTTKYCLEIP